MYPFKFINGSKIWLYIFLITDNVVKQRNKFPAQHNDKNHVLKNCGIRNIEVTCHQVEVDDGEPR
jgi:hypothetical protein